MLQLRLLLTAIITVSVSIGTATAQNAPTISGAEVRIDGLLGSGEAGSAPTTPWGHPDLRGVWNNSTTTPFERLTEEERESGR